MTLNLTPGAYPAAQVPIELYHGTEICPAPSISSTGLKCIANKSPAHYWHGSTLNPYREPQAEKRHFAIGKAVHDLLLLSDRWSSFYYVLPEGFDRRQSKAQADDIAQADNAAASGRTLLKGDDAQLVFAMAAALRANPYATAALTNGEPEVTLIWQDKETGVYCRARPDFLPNKRKIIPDLKTAADASPEAFARAIAAYGYHQTAAHYFEGIEAVYGERPTNWLHVVTEKAAPYLPALYELPAEDIERGKDLNRRALRLFADCLAADKWPGFADEPVQLGLPVWSRKSIDSAIENEGEQNG